MWGLRGSGIHQTPICLEYKKLELMGGQYIAYDSVVCGFEDHSELIVRPACGLAVVCVDSGMVKS